MDVISYFIAAVENAGKIDADFSARKDVSEDKVTSNNYTTLCMFPLIQRELQEMLVQICGDFTR